MRIKIPRKLELKVNLEKAKNVFSFIGVFLFLLLSFTGIVYGVRYTFYQSYAEEKQEQCQVFTAYLNDEVLPLTEANVTGCNCNFDPNEELGSQIDSQCLCSCVLYDANGTLIDEDWNPLFSTI